MTRECFSKGEYLFKAGDLAEKMFYIYRGKIRLPELNKTVDAGQVIGEMGLFSSAHRRTASALCEEDLESFSMSRQDVMDLFGREPERAMALVEISVSRLIENLKRETEARERIRSELRIAHNIQTSMLPRDFPAFPDRHEFDLHAVMEPALEVGGDFYDFFLVDQTKLCLMIGDVSGKGVPAALFMAISKALFKSEALRGYPPDQVISRVNRLLCQGNQMCMFVTVCCVFVNTQTGEVEICSGGHTPALRCAAPGQAQFISTPTGIAVGVMEELSLVSSRFKLSPGELLFLYTDGVTEAMDAQRELFSEPRLQECVGRVWDQDVPEVLQSVRQEVAAHVRKEPQSDDITMMTLRYKGPRAGGNGS
jgi:sigma-B regulation protein RsbU (phosphoserine phosphatase)